ncbi:MAG: glycosyltransferase [Desulfuromonadaceae bacterium]|nr:glycosyltransferase [Desulfuromonadaceae bacterium]MDD5107750.1 glycosyltransferase [Desulfuromonadaceae bacterium]
MRTALISPYSAGPMRGNITTVRRISNYLSAGGVTTVNIAADSHSFSEMERQLAAFKPDLVHGFHAHYCGTITRKLAERFQVPYIITTTGSDIYERRLRNHPDTVKAIECADAVVCFSNNDAEIVTDCYPHMRGSIIVIPQGTEPLPIVEGNGFDISEETFLLLLPAALRPVKRIEFALQALPLLVQFDPTVRLVITGGVIDQDYASSIRSMLSDSPFAVWFGEVPHEKMGSLYDRADLVLNCSSSESMSNSLMEAMSLGRPVLAANIPGNRSLIRHGETGCLFDDEHDFRRLVQQLKGDAAMRAELGFRGRQEILTNFSAHREAEQYLSLYCKLT